MKNVIIFVVFSAVLVTTILIFALNFNSFSYAAHSVLPIASGGMNAIHLKTNISDAIYYAYLDQNTGDYMITAYSLDQGSWIDPVYISPSGASSGDLHYMPSVGVLPNGSIVIFSGYSSDLIEFVSKGSVFSEDAIQVLSQWNNPHDISSSGISYPRPICYDDRILVFVRIGSSAGGDMAYYTYNQTLDNWSITRLTNTASSLESPYYNVWSSKNALYLDYSIYGIENGDWGRRNTYLISSVDEGSTWTDWKNTTLSLPFDVNEPFVCTAPDYTQASKVWNENGKTFIEVETAQSKFWQYLDGGFSAQVIIANGTVPSNNIVWNSLTTIKDNTGSNLTSLSGKSFVDNNIWYFPIIGYPTELSKRTDSQYAITNSINELMYGGGFYPIDFDNSLTLGTYEKVYLGQAKQGAYETPKTFQTLNSGAWFFSYEAKENASITNICTLVNISTSANGGYPSYYVALYDDNGTILGQASLGDTGVYGSNQFVPICRYESVSLDNIVNLTEGQSYWIGTTGLTGGSMFYDNFSADSTQAYTAFYSPSNQYIESTLSNYQNKTYYNYSATIFATQKVTAIFGEVSSSIGSGF